jgi:hypothetical protein
MEGTTSHKCAPNMGLVSCAMKTEEPKANISQSSGFIRMQQAPAMRLPDMLH